MPLGYYAHPHFFLFRYDFEKRWCVQGILPGVPVLSFHVAFMLSQFLLVPKLEKEIFSKRLT